MTCVECGQRRSTKRSDARYCSGSCRQRAYRKRNGQGREIVTSAVKGKNWDLIAHIAKLYLSDGDVIADVTFGKGHFWRKTGTEAYDFRPTDLQTGTDCRDLPYPDSSLDVLVLDPPYLSNRTSASALPEYNDSYRIGPSFELMDISSNADVLELYRAAMVEADRVVKRSGQVWVKCQDAHTQGQFHLNHVEIHRMAIELGWEPTDLFVLVSNDHRPMRWSYQKRSRKNHSYLWVFTR